MLFILLNDYFFKFIFLFRFVVLFKEILFCRSLAYKNLWFLVCFKYFYYWRFFFFSPTNDLIICRYLLLFIICFLLLDSANGLSILKFPSQSIDGTCAFCVTIWKQVNS